MPWIECHSTLFDHPKTRELSEKLGCSLNDSVAGLLRFWCWCLEYADKGDLREHKPSRVAYAFGVPASSGKMLVNALIETGWLDRKPSLRVHNWWKHAGLFLQNRYKRRPRVWKKIRAAYGKSSPWDDEPDVLPKPILKKRPKPHACSTHAAPDHRTEPDRTEPDRTVPPPHRPSAADADESVCGKIHGATGKQLSQRDIARISVLKARHGPQFDVACEHLHSGIDNVPAYLQAVLEPGNPAGKLAQQVKELLRAKDANN